MSSSAPPVRCGKVKSQGTGLRRLFAAVAAASFGVGILAAPASATTSSTLPDDDDRVGGLGIRLTEAPVSAGDDPRARVYIVDHLAPGSVIERGVEVTNMAGSAQRVELYAAAATIIDGSFTGADVDTSNELSTWTSVAPAEANIGPGDSITATVTIAVPPDAAPGEQFGVVWAEARSQQDAGGIVQVSRVGIRLYVSVGPGGPPAADFTIDSFKAGRSPEGLPVLTASVQNTGGRALDIHGSLSLSDGPGGVSAGPFPTQIGRTLAVGDVQPVSIILDERLPAGPWTASVTLESGLTTRTAEATITFPDSGEAATVDAEDPASTGSWLWTAFLAAAGLLVTAGFAVTVLARRRRRPPATWGAPTGAARHHEAPRQTSL